MSDDRVLVLGGTGFIGANVARALLARGHRVRVLRRASSGLRALEGVEADVELATGDLRDRASLEAAMADCRFVVHAAGHYPTSSLDPAATLVRGVTEMRNVLAAARAAGVERLAYTSTLTTVGPPREGRSEADERDLYVPGSVDDAYFEVKWAMEQEVYRAVAEGMDAVVLVPGIVLGPWDVKPTSGRIVTLVARDRLHAFAEATVPVVHARDVAAGHVAALERGARGERYILGGENVSVRRLLFAVASMAGATPPRFEVPHSVVRAASLATEYAAKAGAEAGKLVARVAPAAGRAMRRPPLLPLEGVDILRHAHPLDSSKARRELGVDFATAREAARDALDWFRASGYLRS